MIIIITVLTINVHCMKMLLDQHRKNIGIYRLIGISTVRLTVAVWCRICCVLLPLLPVIQGLLYFAVKSVIGFYSRLFPGSDFNEEFRHVQLETAVYVPCIMIALYLLAGLLIVYVQVRTAGLSSTRNGHRLKWRRSRKNDRIGVTPHAIAKRHMKIARIAGILTTFCICFACVSFTATNITFARVNENKPFYEKYDYYAELDSDLMLCSPEEMVEQTMTGLAEMQMDGVKVEPYYYLPVMLSVPRSAVYTDYLNVLAKNGGNVNELIDPFRQNIDVPVYICGFTDTMWEHVMQEAGGSCERLEDGCATVFQYLVNYRPDVRTLDFDVVSAIPQAADADEPYQAVINRVEDKFPMETAFQNCGIVAAVNIATFQRLTGMNIPWSIGYYVDEQQNKEFQTLFTGFNFVNLVNVHESESYRKCQQAETVLQRFVFVFMMLFAYSVLHMVTTLRMRCHSHEYQIMHVLGIPQAVITRTIRLEVLYTLLPAIVVSNIVNTVVTLADRASHIESYSPGVFWGSIGTFHLIMALILVSMMMTAKRIAENK